MWELRIPVNPSWIITSGLTEEVLSGYFASPERPGAVIVGNCSDQPLVTKALRESALAIPRELSVLVMDENMACTQSSGSVRTSGSDSGTDSVAATSGVDTPPPLICANESATVCSCPAALNVVSGTELQANTNAGK